MKPASYIATPHLMSAAALVVITMAGCAGSDTGNSVIVDSMTGNTASVPDTVPAASDPAPMSGEQAPLVIQPPTSVDAPALNDAVLPSNAPPTVPVSFDINVPAFQSDSLRVTLVWGDKTLNADWVGDEYWSVSDEFPANTEQLLTVTFYDGNGDIALARASRAVAVGANATAPVLFIVDRFDTQAFDDDRDGISNLDELIAGTDPFVDDSVQLEVKLVYALAAEDEGQMSVSADFESLLGTDRPLMSTFESQSESMEVAATVNPEVISGEAMIDSLGNGTLSYNYLLQPHRITINALRTRSNQAIAWEGVHSSHNNGFSHRISVKNTVTVIDEQTAAFAESVTGRSSGTYITEWETTSNLTGKRVGDSSLCEPVAGLVSATSRTDPGNLVTVTTVVKEIDDPYWRVVTVTNNTTTKEYFVRRLLILQSAGIPVSTLVPEDAFFICDFPEF